MDQTGRVRTQYHFWPGTRGKDAWDVQRLIALSADLPVETVRLDEIGEVDSVYWFDGTTYPATVRAVIEHCRLIAEVDLTHPIILGPDGRVMDGMHRIARSILDGHDSIQARRFIDLPPPDFRDVNDPTELPY